MSYFAFDLIAKYGVNIFNSKSRLSLFFQFEQALFMTMDCDRAVSMESYYIKLPIYCIRVNDKIPRVAMNVFDDFLFFINFREEKSTIHFTPTVCSGNTIRGKLNGGVWMCRPVRTQKNKTIFLLCA